MPRSSGGRSGSFSSASSRPNTKRDVASTVALSAATKRLTGDSNSCQVVFDHYEKCVETEHLHHAGACDFLRELRESCSRFKRDPRRCSLVDGQKQWEESKRRAAAAGFASLGEYVMDKYSKDPAMCRAAYRRYKECVSRDPSDTVCDVLRHSNCEQFRS